MQQQNTHRIWMTTLTAVAGLGLTGCMTRGPRVVEPAPTTRTQPPSRAVQAAPAVDPSATIQPTIILQDVAPAYTPGVPATPVGETYKVKKGDLLSKIAYDFGLNWRDLAEYNNLSNPNHLRAGSTLVIPPYAKKHPAPAKPASSTASSSSSTPSLVSLDGGKYVVKKNDSLWVVARKTGTTVPKLKEANKLTSDRLLVGQTLIIPGAATVAGSGKIAPVSVASVSPVTTKGSTAAPAPTPRPALVLPTPNPLSLEAPSTSAAEAVVEGSASAAAVASVVDENAFSVMVEEGETLEDIARAYLVPVEVVRELNKLSENAVLKAGDSLLIPSGTY